MAHGLKPSPYRPGTGLEPPYLGDRSEELERFRSYLADPAQPRNVLVTGLRGVGKTVLLNHYSTEAEAARWAVVEREFSESDAVPATFAQTVLADLTTLTRRLSLSARVAGGARGLADAVADFLSSLTVTYGDMAVGLSPRRHSGVASGRFDDDLREALKRVGELCAKSEHPGFVVRYDEFHVIRERPNTLTLSALLAAVSGVQQRGTPVMLVLSGLPPLIDNLARSKSYSERMFLPEVLGNLRPPEDRAALKDPAARNDRRFADEVVELVLEDTGGYPYFIQLYGDQLWTRSREQVIGLGDFRRHRAEILSILDRGFFDNRYSRASEQERRLLQAIAEHGERARLDQLQASTGKRNNELQPLVASLLGKGLLFRPARGWVAFTAPMFGEYLKRRAAG